MWRRHAARLWLLNSPQLGIAAPVSDAEGGTGRRVRACAHVIRRGRRRVGANTPPYEMFPSTARGLLPCGGIGGSTAVRAGRSKALRAFQPLCGYTKGAVATGRGGFESHHDAISRDIRPGTIPCNDCVQLDRDGSNATGVPRRARPVSPCAGAEAMRRARPGVRPPTARRSRKGKDQSGKASCRYSVRQYTRKRYEPTGPRRGSVFSGDGCGTAPHEAARVAEGARISWDTIDSAQPSSRC